jgi:hypothetical protein
MALPRMPWRRRGDPQRVPLLPIKGKIRVPRFAKVHRKRDRCAIMPFKTPDSREPFLCRLVDRKTKLPLAESWAD